MLMNSTKILLTNTMMIGVIMTICANNWFSMWLGMEITLLSFVPAMQTNKIISSESMIKYFITQSVASTLMLLSISTMLIGVSMENEMVLMMALLIKVGSAPFHNWVLMIIETLNFFEMWIMLTIIKIPPLTILYQINIEMLNLPMILGMIISSISCLNQISVRKTMGYSSIYNMSIVLMTINKFNVMILLMLIYAVMLGLLLNLINKLKIKFINQMIFNEKLMAISINVWVNMLSMGGFPPMMGFISKLMVIQIMIVNNKILLASIIVSTSMLVMLFYMRLVFTSIMTTSMSSKWMKISLNSYFNFTVNMIFTPLLVSMTMVL